MSLIETIQSIIADSKANMGVAIHHIETGESVYINADTLFPMCSVLKIPVLCEAFRQIHAGKFSLDERIELTLAEKNLPSGVLVFFQDGLMPTFRDLLTVMIIISDNTATDMVMHRVGTENIHNFMHELGLTDIHVTMTIRDIFDDLLGAASDPRRSFTNLAENRTMPDINKDGTALRSDPTNDVSSARAMTQLLTKIYTGQIVNRAACDDMLHILLQQQLNSRLPLFLPYGVPFAHKTGTLAGIRNDAGILYASDTSHVAMTVYTRWSTEETTGNKVAEWKRINEIDSAMGHIGKTVYDYFREK
ncbi:MAG: serine hydrolase [Chloroflexota bacterium]